jgi:hypothetical protein
MTPHQKQRQALASLAPPPPPLFVQPVCGKNPMDTMHVYLSTGDGMDVPELGADKILVVLFWGTDERLN